MKTQSVPQSLPHDLASLRQVQLDSHHAALLERVKSSCSGSAPWRYRKQAEAHDLCRLAQISGHLVILHLDLALDLRVDLLMRVTVPCMPNPKGRWKWRTPRGLELSSVKNQ